MIRLTAPTAAAKTFLIGRFDVR